MERRRFQMTVVFISPYLKDRHAGGGEKHLFDVALALPKEVTVNIAISLPIENFQTQELEEILLEYKQFYSNFIGQSLDHLQFVTTPLFTNAPWWSKIWWTKKFDTLYYVSDGSLFINLNKLAILHVQTPPILKPSFFSKFKLKFWNKVSCNSFFTRSIFEKQYGKTNKISVLYPMADHELFTIDHNKANLIIHIGRFFSHQHSKRQDVLVKAFSQLIQKYPKEFQSWKLIMIGDVENQAFFDKVRSLAKGLPIEFVSNCNRPKLIQYLASSKIFWSATGYDNHELLHPDKVEHFGKALVEAMASQVVPVVTAKGGHKEIMINKLERLTWESIDECVEITAQLVKNKSQLKQYSRLAQSRASDFAETDFKLNVITLFSLKS